MAIIGPELSDLTGARFAAPCGDPLLYTVPRGHATNVRPLVGVAVVSDGGEYQLQSAKNIAYESYVRAARTM